MSCSADDSEILSGGAATLTADGGLTYSWSNGGTTGAINITSFSATTTYTVTATNVAGCVGTATATLTLVAGVTASVTVTESSCTSDDSKVLSGASVTLTAGGGSNYVWNTGQTTNAITKTPTATTTYSVTVSTGSCSGTTSNTITIVTAPSAEIAETDASCVTNDSKVLTNETATLTASGGDSYSWSPVSSTGAVIAYSNATAGTYTVTVTVTSLEGCTATASTSIEVSNYCYRIQAILVGSRITQLFNKQRLLYLGHIQR
jgi:hypothetical protein